VKDLRIVIERMVQSVNRQLGALVNKLGVEYLSLSNFGAD
jgi:hypothetical protein